MRRPKIRTITLATGDRSLEGLVQAARTLPVVRSRLEEAGFVVQTQRVAWPEFGVAEVGDPAFYAAADAACGRLGIDYLSIGCTRQLHAAPKAAEIIVSLGRLSFSTLFAEPQALRSGLLDEAVQAIRILSADGAAGLGNFKLCTSFATPPHIPFFPAAYSSKNTAFCVGLENAEWLASVFENMQPTDVLQFHDLGDEVRGVYEAIEKACMLAARETGTPFEGVDTSIVPSVEVEGSMVAVLGALGSEIGRPGTTALCERLTAGLREIPVRQAGFRGLMFPVLEDKGLSQLGTRSGIRVNDLLLYSCICGVGLDMLPLPGDINDSKLRGLLIDVGALSFRLRKPLMARLLPIPGKNHGEMTAFDAGYVCNCAVVDV